MDTGKWPAKRQMQDKLGHDVAGMHRSVTAEIRARAADAPYVISLLDAVLADPALNPMIALFSNYGQSGRFHYLDRLADTELTRPAPEQLWREAETAIDTDSQIVELFNRGLASGDEDSWEELIHARNQRLADPVSSMRELVEASWSHGCAGPVGRPLSSAQAIILVTVDRRKLARVHSEQN